MKKVKFVEVSVCRGFVDVWNVVEREGENVKEMFEKFCEEVVEKMKKEMLECGDSEEVIEMFIEEECYMEGNGFRFNEEGFYFMIEEGSKFWDIENWKEWEMELCNEFSNYICEC